ncbi:MAG: hypothetical protein ABIH39_04205 [Candidatus Margulisiibacteriota bacterium]
MRRILLVISILLLAASAFAVTANAELEITNAVVAPNPYNPSSQSDPLAHIGFEINKTATARFYLYTLSGERIWVYSSSTLSTGYNEVLWDGSSDYEQVVADGVYFGYLVVDDGSGGKDYKLLKIAVLR